MERNVTVAAVLGLAAIVFGGIAAWFSLNNAILRDTVPPPPSPFAAFGPDCEIAPVSKEHMFVAAGVYQGDTLTNVQLGDRKAASTMVRVAVAPGSQPVTVLLQSQEAVIWSFEGAVERIARAIIIPGLGDNAAVAGLSADRVDILKLARCPARSIPLDANPLRRYDIMRGFFGRQPERVAADRSPNAITLPDLQFSAAPKGGPERNAETKAEKRLLEFFPGGFRVVDAKSLVSRAELRMPETYPLEAGLIQLERAGAIRPARREEIDDFAEGLSKQFRSKLSPDFRVRVSFSYVILRDVMLPPGLHGGHLTNFLVMPGVPAPRGNIGHGCLAFMDGFRAYDQPCFGDAWEGMETLKKLPDANATAACRLLDPPADASVEAVSIYQPKGAKHSGNSTRVPSPVDIKVTKPGAVLLVLNTYEPAIWRIAAGEGTEIVGVILTGYYASKIEGISPNTPVVQIDYESQRKRPAVSPACAPLYAYLGSSFRGGASAMVIDRQVSALVGKGLDGIRGDYALSSVEIR